MDRYGKTFYPTGTLWRREKPLSFPSASLRHGLTFTHIFLCDDYEKSCQS
jgi:hypothetical protein